MSLIGPRPTSVDDLPPRPRHMFDATPLSFPTECVCGDTLRTITDFYLHRCGLPSQAFRGERNDRCLL